MKASVERTLEIRVQLLQSANLGTLGGLSQSDLCGIRYAVDVSVSNTSAAAESWSGWRDVLAIDSQGAINPTPHGAWELLWPC